MTAPTGRRAGRPLNLARLVRLACQDAAPAALESLARASRLGDVQACEAIIRLALELERDQGRANA